MNVRARIARDRDVVELASRRAPASLSACIAASAGNPAWCFSRLNRSSSMARREMAVCEKRDAGVAVIGVQTENVHGECSGRLRLISTFGCSFGIMQRVLRRAGQRITFTGESTCAELARSDDRSSSRLMSTSRRYQKACMK